MKVTGVTLSGGCYCGALRYEASGDVLAKGMCFCRECRHISGGGANVLMGMPASGFAYTQGQPSQFARPEGVTREFCGNCGTHILTRSPRMAGAVLLKAGSLDDQDAFDMPTVAVYCSEKKAYHIVPDGVRAFDKFPQG
jgi:hypothetical protein